jgi:hypothetical protein
MLPTDESFVKAILGNHSAKRWWPPGGLWPTLGLAQHYGIPTRLLDWSEDPMVSAYFAATSSIRTAANQSTAAAGALSVWMLSATVLERISLIDGEQSDGKVEGSRPKLHVALRIIDAPYSGNPNLAAQRGRFILVIRREGGLERRCLSEVIAEIDNQIRDTPLIRLAGNSAKSLRDHLVRIDLPTEEAPELVAALKMRGYDANRLFPGYLGAANAILESTAAMRHRRIQK